MRHTEQDKQPTSLSPEQRWTDDRLTTLTRSWSLTRMAREAMRIQDDERLKLMESVSRGSNLFGRFSHIETPVTTTSVNADVVRGMAHGDMLGGLRASVLPAEQEAYVDAMQVESDTPELRDIRERVQQQALPTIDLQGYTNEQFSQAA